MSFNSEKSSAINSLSECFSGLEKKGFVDSFLMWLKTVSLSEVSGNDPNALKNNLKLILVDLVDTHLPTHHQMQSPSPIVKKRAPKSQAKASKVKRTRKSSDMSQEKVLQSSKTLNKLSCSQTLKDDFINDFSHIKGCATFYKSKKKFSLLGEPTPGPAAYCPTNFLKQSPRILIPVSGARMEFASLSSPGPAAYTPRIHFQAKAYK